MNSYENSAILIRDLCFDYTTKSNRKQIVNNVSLSVPKGIIYGLLGPSGSGKTTLLKLVIGFLRPTAGSVSIFGYKPGSTESGVPGNGVGFMPQEIGLPDYMKVNEVFQYFGSLYLMTNEEVRKQTKYILSLLDLHDRNATVASLSGGQKRRLSLAIAVFNEPRLLILDEPTVGVDPLLRKVIWYFLTKLVREKCVTVIVTTHYIEEMRCANKVAFMRDGQVLEECAPLEAMHHYHSESLEQVFYHLCYNQDNQKESNTQNVSKSKQQCELMCDKFINEPIINKSHRCCFSRNIIIMTALCLRILISVIRHRSFIFVYLLPMFVTSVVFFGIGRTPKNVKIGWVVEEKRIENETHFITNYTEFTPYLPDLLRKRIDKQMFEVIEYSDAHTAIAESLSGHIHGFIHLKANFSDDFYNRDYVLDDKTNYVSNETIDSGSIHLILDMTNRLLSDLVIRELLDTSFTFRGDAFEAIGINRNITALPIQVAYPIYGSADTRHFSQLTNSLTINTLLMFVFGLSLVITAMAYHFDANDASYSRVFSTGVRPDHVIIGETFIRFVIMSSVTLVNIAFVVFVLKVTCKGSLLLITINLLLQCLCGISIGTMFSLIFTSTAGCQICCTAFILFSLTTSGSFWPNEAIPFILQKIVRFLPISFPITTQHYLFNYATTYFVRFVLPGYCASLVYTILTLFISWVLLVKPR